MTEPAGLAEVLLDRRPLADVTITSTNRCNVHLVPATHRLDKADVELPAMNGFEFALRKAIAGVPEGDYRYVIIDTHPGFTVTTRVALAASTDVLIPAKPSLWPMRGSSTWPSASATPNASGGCRRTHRWRHVLASGL